MLFYNTCRGPHHTRQEYDANQHQNSFFSTFHAVIFAFLLYQPEIDYDFQFAN